MNFQTFVKNNQTRYLSKTWQDKMTARIIKKNNYQATGDLKKAKTFVQSMTHLPVRHLEVAKRAEQHLIFSSDMLDSPLGSPFIFA